jgi:predicted lactoylglutathione lyase
LGFALSSKQEVDEIAFQAKKEGILFWETREEPFPVGYYCGVLDPDGKIIEFSFGQPLGNLVSENT